MTVRRVMGTEVEYGIVAPGLADSNPITLSTQVVNAWGAAHSPRTRWDYAEETPLRDARGFDMARSRAHPSQFTDLVEDPQLVNVVLTNGARLYVDHAHPEYSAPEVCTPLDVVLHERAGELVMAAAACAAQPVAGSPVLLYKNNTDNKGASYGAHENYLMARATPFARIVQQLTPFLVSRQVICGAGRVGIGQFGAAPGFQISQRADFIEAEVGLETTLRRPIINTRDEPHADAGRYRRLHVIIGDANMSQVQVFLKTGTTALVLAMIEADALGEGWDLTLAHPVAAVHQISHDPTLRATVELADGRALTALQLQGEYLNRARAFMAQRPDDEPQTQQLLDRWEAVLTGLEADPMSCAGELDWVAKWQLMQRYRERDGIDWDHARLAAVDLQYADIRPEKGLHHRLVAAGRMETLVSQEAARHAVSNPPEETRAYFRGRCLAQYGHQVHAASWDSIIFDIPGRPSLSRVPTPDPLRGTRAHVAALLESSPTAADLLRALNS